MERSWLTRCVSRASGDRIVLFVPGVDIGGGQELEIMILLRGIAGEEGGQADGKAARVPAQLIQVIGAGLVAGKDQHDRLVGCSAVVEQEGGDPRLAQPQTN